MRTRVRDVMTSPVETVGPNASVRTVVERLRTRAISAVPVIDRTGRILGIVSEADLLPKEDRVHVETRRHLLEGRRSRQARTRAAATTAAELMTSPAVTIGEEATIADAASLMRRHGVKRLPVLDGAGALVGIVSRGDLLTVFERDDAEIRAEIVDDVIGRTLLVDPAPFRVTVEAGVVTLRGEADRRTDAVLVERLARRVDGVVGVRSELTYRVDDGDLPVPPPPRTVYPIRF